MQVANWKQTVVVAGGKAVDVVPHVSTTMTDKLLDAARRFEARTDAFAQGKGATCRDIAQKLARFGSFASDKQREFAEKLVLWSQPKVELWSVSDAVAVLTPKVNPDEIATPKLHTVLQKHATFHVGDFKITRRNQDQLCWIVFRDRGAVGKIDNGMTSLWFHKARNAGADIDVLRALIHELEANPLVAAVKYGRLSGRCCSCGRDLTDPSSIEAGIGPICATKF